ncbi:unnamed protein product [Oppiella nova]|uniref:Uncharacterized protein n=1 Tax=Oppiella nova TaxID=334625 RepID=A0A7R9QHJ3_9ACAR|nr:unnamed protein product [Oppiella nova]CAG2165957.1 unnamed protein product [Oppiella nova]
MKCKIVGQNLKAFSKAIRVFAKISSEVLINVDNRSMKLQAINDNKTAFVDIKFDSNFFASFECTVDTKCKLFLKSLILVFRVVNIDKVVDNCTVIMDESMPRVVFEMKCLNGISREYFVPYMESTNLHYNSTVTAVNPSFKVQSKVLYECLHNFSTETRDVSLWLTPQEIQFKSYFDDIEEQNIMTSFAYGSRYFHNYCVNNDIHVTFDVKDLKTFLDFTIFRNQPLDCYFQASGSPIEFRMTSSDHYSATLILATHDFPDDLLPEPPSLNRRTVSSNRSLSLLRTGSLTEVPVNHTPSHNTSPANPNPIGHTNTGTTNTSAGPVSMELQTNANTDDFGEDFDDDEDGNHLFDQIIGQLNATLDQDYGDGDGTQASTNLRFTGTQLDRYHEAIIYGSPDDDDEYQDMGYTEDIVVPESEPEDTD